jgi:hypothetical protein
VKGSPLLQVRWMLQDAKASLESRQRSLVSLRVID